MSANPRDAWEPKLDPILKPVVGPGFNERTQQFEENADELPDRRSRAGNSAAMTPRERIANLCATEADYEAVLGKK